MLQSYSDMSIKTEIIPRGQTHRDYLQEIKTTADDLGCDLISDIAAEGLKLNLASEGELRWARVQAAKIRRAAVEKIKRNCPWVKLVNVKWLPDSMRGSDGKMGEVLNPSTIPAEWQTVEMSRKPAKPEQSDPVWTKKIRSYSLERAEFESPRVLIGDDTDTAIEAMVGASVWAYERRFEKAFEKCSTNLVICRPGNDWTIALFEYQQKLEGLEVPENLGLLSASAVKAVHTRLSVTTSCADRYLNASENPVIGFIGAAKFEFRSHQFTSTHTEYPPRYEVIQGRLVRVEPFNGDGSYNPAYGVASIEAAYVMVRSVMDLQVPKPFDDTITDPLNALLEVEYLWHGSIFLATCASAAVPKMVDNGFTFLFRRF